MGLLGVAMSATANAYNINKPLKVDNNYNQRNIIKVSIPFGKGKDDQGIGLKLLENQYN